MPPTDDVAAYRRKSPPGGALPLMATTTATSPSPASCDPSTTATTGMRRLWKPPARSPLGPGLADMTPTPSSVIDVGPRRTVHRYRLPRSPSAHSPVLLVPPLAAPARCFDLRRGCSMAEHLISLGYPTYLVDYGPISFADRQLGLEHWVDHVIPSAIEAVGRAAGSDCRLPVAGWC